MMWDSSGTPTGSASGPADGTKTAPMTLQVSDQEITVKPDTSLLTGKSTKYPVYLDPALFRTSWTMINDQYPNQSYWAYDRHGCPSGYAGLDCAKVGYTDEAETMTYRSLFEFGTGDYVGKHVLDAKLSMDLLYSWACVDSVTYAHVVNAALGSGTTWNSNAGLWGGAVASVSNSSCGKARRRSEWGVTGTAQTAAANWWPRTTFGLQAADEGSHNGWKKFDAGTAYLTVTYNSYPNAPDGLTIAGAACTTGTSRPYVRTLTPLLKARVSDPDGYARLLSGAFWWWPLGGAQSSGNTVSQSAVASGTTAQASVPTGRLVDGTTYVVRAQAADGIDSGQYSGNCEFTVDATPPPTPGGVASTAYPADGALHGGAGVAGNFTFSPPTNGAAEITGYAYTTDDGIQAAQAKHVTADPTSHSATVSITPPVDGLVTLHVWSVDKAGNHSLTSLSHVFGVRAGSGPDAVWQFTEGSGSTAVDSSAHGNTATLASTTWTPGRGKADSALLLDGTTSTARTVGPITTRDPTTGATTTVRTNANLTVSAWVRLDVAGGINKRAIVSQDGTRAAAFTLDYSGTDDRWRFVIAATDADAPALYRAVSDAAPQIGVWTHLTGTYNATTGKVTLYVNGVAQAITAVAPGSFNATGPLVIGRRLWAGAAMDFFVGAIDDVRVYARLVGTGEAEFTGPLTPTQPSITFPDGTAGRVDSHSGSSSTRVVTPRRRLSSTVSTPSPSDPRRHHPRLADRSQ